MRESRGLILHRRIRTSRAMVCWWLAVLGAVYGLACTTGRAGRLSPEARRKNVESFDAVWTTVRERHFDPDLAGLDWNGVRSELRPEVERARSMEDARRAMREMISRLEESHFGIIPGDVLEAMRRPVSEGSPGGVTGIQVRVIGGLAVVTSVAVGSPAERAGIRPGWEVLTARGEDLAPILARLDQEFAGRSDLALVLASAVAGRIDGSVGETVEVTFRDGRDVVVPLRLELVEERGHRYTFGLVSNIHVWIEAGTLAGGVGYVAFNGFLDPVHVVPAFGEAISRLGDAPGLIVDVRGNGGGMLAVVSGIAGWLIETPGTSLGTMNVRGTSLKAIVNPRLAAFTGPVAVLVDGLSMSGAEVFAAGLRDLGRVRVFGTRTAGAVLASDIVGLPNGDALQFPFADFTTSEGQHLEGVGVTPDEEVDVDRESLLAGRDGVLEAALAWIGASAAASPTMTEDQRRADR